ncbi:amino acid adenylation domain-containing protein [Nocardiopsis alba]|uniref:amino acid adenylation domain-containing protein n=1 Tax=Nocardiopsis alba TaxID=53437 RepID=UPI0034081670
MVERWCTERPDRVALSGDGRTLDYRALGAEARRLAGALREEGVRSGDVVGLLLRRSSDAVIAMLAAWKIGAAYLSLDASLPEARLEWMVRDARPRVLVTDPAPLSLPRGVSDIPLVPVGREPIGSGPPPTAGGGDDMAYVMYTSGSTGTPKGVGIPHRSVRRLVSDPRMSMNPDDVLLQLSKHTFDASVFEIWSILSAGGRLEFLPDPLVSLGEIASTLRERSVSKLFLTTGLFNHMVEFEGRALQSLERLYFGGEAASAHHVRLALETLPGVELVNAYGPTEAGVAVSCHLMTGPDDVGTESVSLGTPLLDTGLHVLDDELRPLPAGEAGELCVSGIALALGYRDRDELTAECFVRIGDGPLAGTRVYRTGDRCMWTNEGELCYLGRSDQQVKVRGHRVEPGEIEAVLNREPRVKQAVVLDRVDGTGARSLVAMVQLVDPEADTTWFPGGLRVLCADRLPGYMVPGRWALIDSVPLTAHGKTDRDALRARL